MSADERLAPRSADLFYALGSDGQAGMSVQDAYNRFFECVHDDASLFSALVAITAAATAALPRAAGCKHHGPDHQHHHVATFVAIDDDGNPQRTEPEDAPPVLVLVGRWIATVGNRDYATASALFASLPNDPKVCNEFVGHLLSTVQRIAREAANA